MTRPGRAPEGVFRVRAPNPSPLTLDGTNTYVIDGWVVDPGPDDAGHLDAVRAAAPGGLAGVVLTHAHPDHAEGAERLGVPVTLPGDGEQVGPLLALATPGHSPDSVCLLAGRTCFTGDTVLGSGSVFIAPGEGSLSSYLRSLERLRGLDLEVLCPGQHPALVWDPAAKLERLHRPPPRARARPPGRPRGGPADPRRAARLGLIEASRRSCAISPRSRWPRTSRSYWRRGGCRTGWSASGDSGYVGGERRDHQARLRTVGSRRWSSAPIPIWSGM